MRPAPYKPGDKLTPHTKPKRVSEKDVEDYLLKVVKENCGITRKWYARGNAGVHDRIVIFPNDEIWLVEVKAPDGKKSPKQKSFHKMLYNEMHCSRSITVWCHEDVDMWIMLRRACILNKRTLRYPTYQPSATELMIGRIKR